MPLLWLFEGICSSNWSCSPHSTHLPYQLEAENHSIHPVPAHPSPLCPLLKPQGPQYPLEQRTPVLSSTFLLPASKSNQIPSPTWLFPVRLLPHLLPHQLSDPLAFSQTSHYADISLPLSPVSVHTAYCTFQYLCSNCPRHQLLADTSSTSEPQAL